MEDNIMKMNEKLEIMLNRRRIKKTDFADSVGITYRAFANYMNGSRRPRKEILARMANKLEVPVEFLANDEKELELTIEERFIKRMWAAGRDGTDAAKFLAQSRGLFAGNSLSDEDKSCLMECLTEIYMDSLSESEQTVK